MLKKTNSHKFITHTNIVMWFEVLASQNTGKNNWIIKAALAFQKAYLNLERRHGHL
jgi:hypothetical protein